MKSKNETISIIIPTYKSANTLIKLVDELVLTFKSFKTEIVIVNDCSPDIFTHENCISLSKKYQDKISYIKLSKNYGEHNAVMAGLRYSEGDLVIIMDDDYQNLPSEALKLVEFTLESEHDVVFAKYKIKKDSFTRNLMSKVANVSAQLLINKPKEIYFSSFKAIKRTLIKEIIKYQGPFPYIDGLILAKTENIGSVEVIHSIREKSKSSYNLYKLAKLYGNLVTNFSTVPIHLFSILGLVITLISFLFIVGILIEKIVNPSVPLGYSTLVTIIFFFSGIQILFLGLIGEYVGKILRNVNKEEQYIVDFVKKRNSY